MVDFKYVSFLEVESTVRALPLLFLQQLGLFVLHKWMLLEPFCPVEQVAIIGACFSSHFHPVLSMRFIMLSHIDGYRVPFLVLDVHAKSGSSIKVFPVFVAHPYLGFPR